MSSVRKSNLSTHSISYETTHLYACSHSHLTTFKSTNLSTINTACSHSYLTTFKSTNLSTINTADKPPNEISSSDWTAIKTAHISAYKTAYYAAIGETI